MFSGINAQRKEVKKTNRKVTLLLIAAVATILPAVAVADVMITGNVNIVGTQNAPVFVIQPGPNYPAANAAGAIIWNPQIPVVEQAQVTPMATFDLEGIVNQTTALANVLDLNVTINAGVTGTLYVNFTGNFPSGAMVWISSSQMNVHDVYNMVAGGQPLNSASFVFNGPFPGGTTTYYISFLLPYGSYAGASGTITGTFIAH